VTASTLAFSVELAKLFWDVPPDVLADLQAPLARDWDVKGRRLIVDAALFAGP
jgi:hypothetical protein